MGGGGGGGFPGRAGAAGAPPAGGAAGVEREVHLGLRRQMCSEAPPSPHPPLPHLVAHRYKKKLGGGTQGTQMWRHDKTVV